MWSSPHRSTHAFFLTRVITSVHIDHFLLKQAFDCVLDLNLVRTRTHAKDILVLLLAHQGRLFSQRSGLNNLVRLVHGTTSRVRCLPPAESVPPIFPAPFR